MTFQHDSFQQHVEILNMVESNMFCTFEALKYSEDEFFYKFQI